MGRVPGIEPRTRAMDVVGFTMKYPSKPYWLALLFPNVERRVLPSGGVLCWVRGLMGDEWIEVIWRE